MIKKLASALWFSAALSSAAFATVIDFEGVATSSSLYVPMSGTRTWGDAYFTSTAGPLVDGSWTTPVYAHNGTDWYWNVNGSFTFGLSNNAGFSVTSFDASNYDTLSNHVGFTMVGSFVGGGTLSQTFTTPAAVSPGQFGAGSTFQTYTFNSGWTNLLSVTMTPTVATSQLAFDNIVLSQTTPTNNPTPPANVPEGASSLWLMSAGLGVLGMLRRKA